MKPDALKLKPRKSPLQARSAVTVDALHAATIQVLIRDGLAGCTTTRIAERAGTSVGSLYQYFPSRDALLAAVLEKHLAAVAVEVEQACRNHHGSTLSQMASAFVLAFITAKLHRAEEAKALYAVAADRGGAAFAARMRESIAKQVAAMLDTAPDAGPLNATVAATTVVDAMVGPIQRLLTQGAHAHKDATRELTTLVTAYLCARSTAS